MATERAYFFNRPYALLLYLPLVLLAVMLGYGMARQPNFFVILIFILTLLFLIPNFVFSFTRRLRVSPKGFKWATLFRKHQIPAEEVKHFGVLRYRQFRFIFISRENDPPFDDEKRPVVSGPDTFVIQFRPGAWEHIRNILGPAGRGLEPREYREPRG